MKRLFICVMVLLAACHQIHQEQADSHEVVTKEDIGMSKTPLVLYPEFAHMDSIVILYYRDKERFRYYTYCGTTDTTTITVLKNALKVPSDSIELGGKDGVIYCYIKGQVYNSVSFNLGNALGGSMGVVHNGTMLTFGMDRTLKTILLKAKEIAIEPVAKDKQ